MIEQKKTNSTFVRDKNAIHASSRNKLLKNVSERSILGASGTRSY